MQSIEPILDSALLGNFVGASPAFEAALGQLRRFARSRAPILITGETGTGKENAAQAAHYLSERRDACFVPVNCGALPDTLLESELFGHASGAFTGARHAHRGLVREAEGGTLFLDEVEALSVRGQVTLLRFLQDASFRSLGEERLRHANVRVIAASNVDLRRMAERDEFRADLLFRLDVLSIVLPPLRDRVGDIAPLAAHLLAKAARSEGGAAKQVSTAGLKLLCAHSWPGNVRELEHLMLRAHLLSTGQVIDTEDLMACSPALMMLEQADAAGADPASLRQQKLLAVRDVERRYVERALARAAGNISEAARLCNMERATLSKMAKKYRPSCPVLPGAL
jgi:transcriptional regulator with PAS, ATPase and Fis domain